MKIRPSIALFYLFLAGVSLPVFALADDGSSGTVSVCLRADIALPPQAMQVVASGTVFTAQTKAGGRKGGEENEALVTTETVTLTHMQPCMDADASTVISHTRRWLVSPYSHNLAWCFMQWGKSAVMVWIPRLMMKAHLFAISCGQGALPLPCTAR